MMATSNVPVAGSMATNNPSSQPAPQQPVDSVNRVRALVWQLKETLATLMKTTASSINHNTDLVSKSGDGRSTRFDKSLEEFFSICNQIELHLRTISESVIQQRDGAKYVPFGLSKSDVPVGGEAIPENTMSYSQYVSTVKTQINFCKQVQDILSEGVRKINHQEVTATPTHQS